MNELALDALHRCRVNTHAALVDAEEARANLAGARQTRAAELREQLIDAVAFCQRLAFIVEGDFRTEQAQR